MIKKAFYGACGWSDDALDDEPDECPSCGAERQGSNQIKHIEYDRG